MIKEIYLKNFKCFDEVKIERLKTFNVIAGKNNYGKTSILDAIFSFYGVRNPSSLLNITGLRNGSTVVDAEKPFWVDYFKDMNTSEKMVLKIRDETSTVTQEYNAGKKANANETLSLSVGSFISNPSQKITGYNNQEKKLSIRVTEIENGKRTGASELFTVEMESNGAEINAQIRQSEKGVKYNFKTSAIITTSKRLSKESTISNVSEIITQKRKNELISNIKKIDNRISDIVIAANGDKKGIYLDIGLNEMTEISMLGEGVSRALSFISLVIVQKNSIILIDEIENGIHFSVIKDVIDVIIKSAKTNGNQVFVTTHSSDVIHAINEFENKKDDICYIRLGRDKKTSSPTVTTYNMDDFSYSVDNDWEIR